MSEPDLLYRREFLESLRLLERAFILVQQRGGQIPVIVGGAAVEYHSGGRIQSGDVDLVEGSEEVWRKHFSMLAFVVRIANADCCGASIFWVSLSR
ncbi:MAG: hypothetical protein U1E52_02905 [Geminicoccaceae bacterium]